MSAIDIALITSFALQALAVFGYFNPALVARLMPESFLLKNGLWCECSGDPMNAWAEEFDRRDAKLAHPLAANPSTGK